MPVNQSTDWLLVLTPELLNVVGEHDVLCFPALVEPDTPIAAVNCSTAVPILPRRDAWIRRTVPWREQSWVASTEGRLYQSTPGRWITVNEDTGQQVRGSIWTRSTQDYRLRIGAKTYHPWTVIGEAFRGPKPYTPCYIQAINDDRADMRPDNLYWANAKTHRLNMRAMRDAMEAGEDPHKWAADLRRIPETLIQLEQSTLGSLHEHWQFEPRLWDAWVQDEPGICWNDDPQVHVSAYEAVQIFAPRAV